MTIIVTDIFKYYHFFYNEEDFYYFYNKYNKDFNFIPKPYNENSKYIEFIMIIKDDKEAFFFHKYLNIYWDLYKEED